MENQTIMLLRIAVGLSIAIASISISFADDTLSADSMLELMEKGGKHWSDSKAGVFGFKKYEKPGRLLYIWPAEDRIYRVNVADDGSGSATVEFRWQLQPGETFDKKFPEYVTYIWGEPDGKADGFQVTNKIDSEAASGKFSTTLSFSKKKLEDFKGEHSLVVVLLSGGPLSNFVQVQLAFPK